jgi:hypothetical protein
MELVKYAVKGAYPLVRLTDVVTDKGWVMTICRWVSVSVELSESVAVRLTV